MFCRKKKPHHKIMNDDIAKSAAIIRSRIGVLKPGIAIVLGSGLGGLADEVQNAVVIPYTDLPGFPRPSVPGHEGKFVAGTIEGVPVITLKGRVHFYEGVGADQLKVMIRTLKTLGVNTMFLSNAAGSLRPDVKPGELMAIADHINLSGTNPMMGENDDTWGPRFFGLGNAWDKNLCTILTRSAAKVGITLKSGVYVWLLGPTFETAAEIRMAKMVGGDSVGMSTVPDCLIARHCGMRVVGCSAITNMGEGMSDEVLSHEHTLSQAAIAGKSFVKVVVQFLKDYQAGH
ncbi:MAG: xapA [Micavibrio sp.]|nr:xapA [Micavibrio sp.]